MAEPPNKRAGASGRLLLVPRDGAPAATATQPLNELPAGAR